MKKDPKGPLPKMNALRAFDAAARRASFVGAANDLGMQQPAISRYIADLEYELGVRLFERSHRTVSLTPAGEVFHHAVAIGLERIATAGRAVSSIAEDQRVIVACTPAISYLVLMPRLETIRRALGETVSLHILSLDYAMLERMGKFDADLILTYGQDDGNGGASQNQMPLFGEAVTPVCSPDFAAIHAEVLAGPVEAWGAMPFLRLARPAVAWMTWHDWFQRTEFPKPPPRYIGIEDYVHLIEASADGQGLALGWRHFINRHLERGRLVQVGYGFVESDRCVLVGFTERGRLRTIARQCFDVICAEMNELAAD